VIQDPAYIRPAEVETLVGNPAKAKQKMDWATQTSFEELVKLMVDAEVSFINKT
jgi:GDPmannose 4,6-dehydratase